MATLPPDLVAALESFKAKVSAEFGPRLKRLVLFGSVARGRARWDSDVDVLVLLDRVDWREAGRIVDLATLGLLP